MIDRTGLGNAYSKEKIMNQSLIQLNQVSKWFDTGAGRFDALKNITLEIKKGEFVAVTGKSGSGKSTLLNMLTGIDHPNSGEVHIGSAHLRNMDESKLAAWRGANVGIVFQFFQLIPTLTVLENLLIAMDFVNKIPPPQRKERALQLLRQVQIEEHKDKFPAGLSGGQQQRAAIARSLANDPPVLVADEPTGNLDMKTAGDVRAIFEELVQTGKTVIIVTHEQVFEKAYDRVITLSDGEIVPAEGGR